MNRTDTPGQAMHSEDEEQRREAARLMGSARTERKSQTSAANERERCHRSELGCLGPAGGRKAGGRRSEELTDLYSCLPDRLH